MEIVHVRYKIGLYNPMSTAQFAHTEPGIPTTTLSADREFTALGDIYIPFDYSVFVTSLSTFVVRREKVKNLKDLANLIDAPYGPEQHDFVAPLMGFHTQMRTDTR